MRGIGVIIAIAGLCAGASAHADAEEWRLALAGSGLSTTTQAAGVDGRQLGFGGRIRFGYGIFDSLEVAVEAGGTRAQAVEFAGAELQGQRGTLYADATLVELALGLRWMFGVEAWRALDRVHPFVGIRGGTMVRLFSGQLLLNANDMILVEPDDEVRLIPFVGGTAGIERRFGDHFFVGVTFDVAVGTDYRHLGGSLELAWSWY
jgi:hypothetical protein